MKLETLATPQIINESRSWRDDSDLDFFAETIKKDYGIETIYQIVEVLKKSEFASLKSMKLISDEASSISSNGDRQERYEALFSGLITNVNYIISYRQLQTHNTFSMHAYVTIKPECSAIKEKNNSIYSASLYFSNDTREFAKDKSDLEKAMKSLALVTKTLEAWYFDVGVEFGNIKIIVSSDDHVEGSHSNDWINLTAVGGHLKLNKIHTMTREQFTERDILSSKVFD